MVAIKKNEIPVIKVLDEEGFMSELWYCKRDKLGKAREAGKTNYRKIDVIVGDFEMAVRELGRSEFYLIRPYEKPGLYSLN